MTERALSARKRATHGYSLLCHLMTECRKVKDENVGVPCPIYPVIGISLDFFHFYFRVRFCDEFSIHVDSSRSNWI